MIKRYHEAPLCMFETVQGLTDGDYALVHLFEENEEYLNAFKQSVAAGRDVILDNSIFELGTAFDGDKFAQWVEELRPKWYIVPDSWKNGKKTAEMFFDFIHKYPDLPGLRIGVAQGYTFAEVANCYEDIADYCDMVAFNLDFSSVFYGMNMGNVAHHFKEAVVPYCVAMSLGRFFILNELFKHHVIRVNKPHHLLGCGVPQEVQWYPSNWNWIRSIDTSNPVIAGIEGWLYDPDYGINKKSDLKLYTQIDRELVWKEEVSILSNIMRMKDWCTKWKTL